MTDDRCFWRWYILHFLVLLKCFSGCGCQLLFSQLPLCWGRNNDHFKKVQWDADLLMGVIIQDPGDHRLECLCLTCFNHLAGNGLSKCFWNVLDDFTFQNGQNARSLLGRPSCFGGWPNVDTARGYGSEITSSFWVTKGYQAEMTQFIQQNKNRSSPQGGAPKIAKLGYNSNNYGLWYL